MKKRALCALVSLALCVTLAGQAAAAESSVSFVVNGITLAADVPNRVEARTTYVSYWPIVSALYPNATAEWVNGQAEVKADGLTLHINVPYGKNTHHMLEAIFKGVARAMSQAVALDPRVHGVMSSKGAL